jgi:hypothetical protein
MRWLRVSASCCSKASHAAAVDGLCSVTLENLAEAIALSFEKQMEISNAN